MMYRSVFAIQLSKKYHVGVTTLGLVHQLLKLKVTGHFTHILIDEAAQVTVPEVMMALSLASSTIKLFWPEITCK